MPYALAAPGMIKGQKVSTQPNWRINTNDGTIITALGIAIVANKNEKRTDLPGKSNFANPYPPRDVKNNLRMVADKEMTTVFSNTWAMFASWKMNR